MDIADHRREAQAGSGRPCRWAGEDYEGTEVVRGWEGVED